MAAWVKQVFGEPSAQKLITQNVQNARFAGFIALTQL
jgi:hypothetical protein